MSVDLQGFVHGAVSGTSEAISVWMVDHQLGALALVVGFVLAAVGIVIANGRRREHAELLKAAGFIPQKRGRMLRRQREKFVDGLIANDIIENIEFRVFHKEITREEANVRYRKLASLLSNRGLFPATETLKDLIRLRLANKEPKPAIPGDKPPAVASEPVAQVNVVPLFTFKKKVA